MPPKRNNSLRCTFQFDYKVTTRGVPQPYPLAPRNSKILLRVSPVEDENGHVRDALNICGTREGLKHLAAMLILCADSEKYDSHFHIHLEDQSEVEADMSVTIRAPFYLDWLRKEEFSEFRGTSIAIPPTKSKSRGLKSKRRSLGLRPKKPRRGRKV